MISDGDLEKLDLATETFEGVLRGEDAIGPQPSRCPGWSTRDVANHVLGGAIRYAHYFSGVDPAEIAWSRTADHVGDDPAGAHRKLADALRREFVDHRDDGIVLHHPLQDVGAPTLLVMRVQELVFHGWDIASVAEPGIELDPSLCRFLLDGGETVRTMLRTHGVLGHGTTPAGGGLTAKVLAEWGRG